MLYDWILDEWAVPYLHEPSVKVQERLADLLGLHLSLELCLSHKSGTVTEIVPQMRVILKDAYVPYLTSYHT